MLEAVLVQCLQHEATAYYLVLALRGLGSERQFLALDVSSDYRRNGRIFYGGEELLASRRREGSVWAPSPALEFGCYLVKKVAKRSLDEAHGRRLSVLYGMDPAGCEREVARFWDPPSLDLIVEAARSGRWDAVRGCLADLRRRLIGPGSRGALRSSVEYWSSESVRRVHRWRSATGVHVVLLGTDGAGKSTTSAALEDTMAPAFRRVARHHLAPALIRRGSPGPPATRPHALPPRGVFGSLAKILYWGLDYTVGYLLLVRPALARSALVLFDRYLLDVLVDARRYRYGGPRWLLRALWLTVPKPDLVLLLDAPTEVLYRRKGEIPFAECERQRTAYRSLVDGLSNGHVIDAAQPLDRVVADAGDVVLDFMAERTAQRLGANGVVRAKSFWGRIAR